MKGSKRWLDFFFLPRFQPIELLKPFIIITIASILSSEKNNNIYGKEISVNLLNFIRKEKKFDGIESLKTQIKNDVRVSKEFFNLQ